MATRNMSRTASTVGMMDGAFFVSRSDLLAWVNDLLLLNVQKVEQCASGAVYCQIIDACHPGTVAMRKLNWMAKCDHEFIPNYKILQAAFDKNSIQKHIEVDRLCRAKYQDNLEFLQWMKCYWEREAMGRRDYDPVAMRVDRPLPTWAKSMSELSGLSATRPRAADRGEKENLRPRTADRGEGRGDAGKKPVVAEKPRRPEAEHLAAGAAGPQAGSPASDLQARCDAQHKELVELREMVEGFEGERDYYFRKLREVEIFCTTMEANIGPDVTPKSIIEDIQTILYAGGDDEA